MVQMFMRDLKKVSALERFCYKGFLRNSSGAKFFVRLREVSAIEDVRFREFPLYIHIITSICGMEFFRNKGLIKNFIPQSGP